MFTVKKIELSGTAIIRSSTTTSMRKDGVGANDILLPKPSFCKSIYGIRDCFAFRQLTSGVDCFGGKSGFLYDFDVYLFYRDRITLGIFINCPNPSVNNYMNFYSLTKIKLGLTSVCDSRFTDEVTYIEIDFDTVDRDIIKQFVERGFSKDFVFNNCLDTQNINFVSNTRCGKKDKFQTENLLLNVDNAGIPSKSCTDSIEQICKDSTDPECACYNSNPNIPIKVQSLLEANKDLYPDGLCKSGEIKNTCLPRICVLPDCMSGKAYKSAEELRYKCPKFCSGIVSTFIDENGEINYNNSNLNIDCGENSMYIPTNDKNTTVSEVTGERMPVIKPSNIPTPKDKKNTMSPQKISLISSVLSHY